MRKVVCFLPDTALKGGFLGTFFIPESGNEEYECQQTSGRKSLGFTKCFLPHCKVAYPNLTKPKGLPAAMPSKVRMSYFIMH